MATIRRGALGASLAPLHSRGGWCGAGKKRMRRERGEEIATPTLRSGQALPSVARDDRRQRGGVNQENSPAETCGGMEDGDRGKARGG